MNDMATAMQASQLVQQLIGCSWGRVVVVPDDQEVCDEQAVRIVVVHDGDASIELRLCDRHVERLSRETTPRQST